MSRKFGVAVSLSGLMCASALLGVVGCSSSEPSDSGAGATGNAGSSAAGGGSHAGGATGVSGSASSAGSSSVAGSSTYGGSPGASGSTSTGTGGAPAESLAGLTTLPPVSVLDGFGHQMDHLVLDLQGPGHLQ